MQYTEQQKAEFRQEFKAKRKRQIILAIPVIACMLLLFALSETKAPTVAGLEASVVLPPVLVMVVAAVAYSFYNWRCPACRKYLGKAISPSFCARCGVGLQ